VAARSRDDLRRHERKACATPVGKPQAPWPQFGGCPGGRVLGVPAPSTDRRGALKNHAQQEEEAGPKARLFCKSLL